jgi:hypothetical protein
MVLVVAALVASALPSWSAEPAPKTLVIADTGFNIDDPVIASHTVYQLCMIDWYACPNGSNIQESGTAAMLTSNQLQSSGFSHGSKMARAAIAAYPDVKLILIRIVGQFNNGARMSTSETMITKVLTWADRNATTYNIGAVAISQGSSKTGTNARHCLASPQTDKVITSLRAKGIYSFFPAGNEGRTESINWPACIADSVAVGAFDKSGKIASYSNYAIGQVDIYEPGFNIDPTISEMYRDESGTSYSAQYAAAKWLSLVNHHPVTRPSLIYWTYVFSGDVIFGNNGITGWNSDYASAESSLTS